MQNKAAFHHPSKRDTAMPARSKCSGSSSPTCVWTVCPNCTNGGASYICGACCEELGAMYETLSSESPKLVPMDLGQLRACSNPPWITLQPIAGLVQHKDTMLYKWTNGCPICAEAMIAPCEVLIPVGYKEMEPRVVDKELLFLRGVTWVNDDGSECQKDISIEVVTLEPLMERGIARRAFTYKYYQRELHGEYMQFEDPPDLAVGAPLGTSLWRLVRTTEGICLSLIWFNGLTCAAASLQGCWKDLRVAAGVEAGSLRTDRCGGQQGVAVGSLQQLKRKLCSRNVMGAPARPAHASVAVPMMDSDFGGAATSVRQLYFSTIDGHVCNMWGRSAPPQAGFYVKGEHVSEAMSKPEHTQIVCRFTAALLTAAHVLLEIGTSTEAAGQALLQYEQCKCVAEANAADSSPPRTRRRFTEAAPNRSRDSLAAVHLFVAAHNFTGQH